MYDEQNIKTLNKDSFSDNAKVSHIGTWGKRKIISNTKSEQWVLLKVDGF